MSHPAPRARTAFTLAELLVVVVIIAILTAFVVEIIPVVQTKVAGTQTQNQMSKIANAIQQYYGDFHAYPGPLTNTQLGSAYDMDATGVQINGNAVNVGQPFVINPADGTPVYLAGTDGGTLASGGTYPLSATSLTGSQLGHITGAENLFLGLCGGLRLTVDVNGKAKFEYHPEDILPDGKTPAPRGPQSLTTNSSLSRRTNSYIDIVAADISIPTVSSTGTLINNGSFTDAGGRHSTDTVIPEFLDKFSNPLPILYFRLNAGGTAIVGVRDANGAKFMDKVGGTVIANPNAAGYGTTGFPIAVYDLPQVLDYTISDTSTNPPTGTRGIGTFSNDPKRAYHGLQGAGTDPTLTQTVTQGWLDKGLNGIAFLKDPNYSAVTAAQNLGGATIKPSNAGGAVARNASGGFLLISAGPARTYGTSDNIVYPGGAVGN